MPPPDSINIGGQIVPVTYSLAPQGGFAAVLGSKLPATGFGPTREDAYYDLALKIGRLADAGGVARSSPDV